MLMRTVYFLADMIEKSIEENHIGTATWMAKAVFLASNGVTRFVIVKDSAVCYLNS